MKRVLIVDDNHENKGIYDGREIDNIEFCVVTDELSTLRTLTEGEIPFDAVLLDLSMPILDGFELATQIRLNQKTHLIDPNLKIAFYTSWDIDNDIQRMMDEAKVTHFFRKPIDPVSLAWQINHWLQPVT